LPLDAPFGHAAADGAADAYVASELEGSLGAQAFDGDQL